MYIIIIIYDAKREFEPLPLFLARGHTPTEGTWGHFAGLCGPYINTTTSVLLLCVSCQTPQAQNTHGSQLKRTNNLDLGPTSGPAGARPHDDRGCDGVRA
jgi:hypothetical protein